MLPNPNKPERWLTFLTVLAAIFDTIKSCADELVNAQDITDRKHRFVSVHASAIGPGNRLLALDTAASSLDRYDPQSAKLWVIDLDTDAIVHGIGFPADIVLPRPI